MLKDWNQINDRDRQEYRAELERIARCMVGLRLPLLLEESTVDKLGVETCLAMAEAHAACVEVYRSKVMLYTQIELMNALEINEKSFDLDAIHQKASAFIEHNMLACITPGVAEELYLIGGREKAGSKLFMLGVIDNPDSDMGFELGYMGKWAPGCLN